MENLYDETIEKLLSEKSFSELNLKEKEKVLQLYTSLEYDEIHKYLIAIKLSGIKEKDRLSLSSKNKKELQDYFKEKNKPEQRIFLNFQINPFHVKRTAVLAASLGILFFIIYGKVINQSNDYPLSEEEFNKYTTFNTQEIPKYNSDDETTDYLMKMQF